MKEFKLSQKESRAISKAVSAAFNAGGFYKFTKHSSVGDDRAKFIGNAVRGYDDKQQSIKKVGYSMAQAAEAAARKIAKQDIDSRGVVALAINIMDIIEAVEIKDSYRDGLPSLNQGGADDTIIVAVEAIIRGLNMTDGVSNHKLVTLVRDAVIVHSAYVDTLRLMRSDSQIAKIQSRGNEPLSPEQLGELLDRKENEFIKRFRAKGHNAFSFVMAHRAKLLGQAVQVNAEGFPAYKQGDEVVGTAFAFGTEVVKVFLASTEVYNTVIKDGKVNRYELKDGIKMAVYSDVYEVQRGRKHSLAFINELIPDVHETEDGGININTRFDTKGSEYNVISGQRNDHGDLSNIVKVINIKQKNGIKINQWVMDNAPSLMAAWDEV